MRSLLLSFFLCNLLLHCEFFVFLLACFILSCFAFTSEHFITIGEPFVVFNYYIKHSYFIWKVKEIKIYLFATGKKINFFKGANLYYI